MIVHDGEQIQLIARNLETYTCGDDIRWATPFGEYVGTVGVIAFYNGKWLIKVRRGRADYYVRPCDVVSRA